MNNLIIIFSFFFGVLAPMPTGIAYNPETKECGYYMGGDEYASYLLPAGWVINYGETIQNETGSHQWDKRYDSIKRFCEELGYSYVEGNIATQFGERKASGLLVMRSVCIAAPILFLVILVVAVILIVKSIKRKRKMQNSKSANQNKHNFAELAEGEDPLKVDEDVEVVKTDGVKVVVKKG
ncbi:MAG: hypothetical protein C0410_10645 [Anaerolinea sp.]|nr:hypothetical protein [Anaerolinea sp.]